MSYTNNRKTYSLTSAKVATYFILVSTIFVVLFSLVSHNAKAQNNNTPNIGSAIVETTYYVLENYVPYQKMIDCFSQRSNRLNVTFDGMDKTQNYCVVVPSEDFDF